MLIIRKKRRLRKRLLLGRGLADWIMPAANFLSTNKDTISNIANVIGTVAKTSANTAAAVREIYDAVKNKRNTHGNGVLSKPVQHVLNEKSVEILNRLMH
jgi:hypothetical protein